MGLADFAPALPHGAGAGAGAAPAGSQRDQEPIGDDYRFDGLYEDLPKARMREGLDMLVELYGTDDARRFIDTMTRARVKQLAFNGTDSAFKMAQEYAPHMATAAKHMSSWARTNPVVLGGVLGSVASAALSYVSHRKRVGSSGV